MNGTVFPSPYRKYLYIAGTFIIAALALYGAFWLGTETANNTHTMDVKAIYDQGFAAGEARGMLKMQTQCDDKTLSIVRNCKEWYTPGLRFGDITLTN